MAAQATGALTGRLGLIVNPVAGIGGRVGLKGSDGPEIVARARALGGRPAAPDRARATLRLLAERSGVHVLTAGGQMGADLATEAGLPVTVLHRPPEVTSADDTRATAIAAAAAGADLLLFVGGDGTAADLLGIDVPALGVPAGVKMYSAVFATGPRAAIDLAADYLARPSRDRCEPREVMDVDEVAMRRDERVVRLLGTLLVPSAGPNLQGLKATGAAGERSALDALAREVVRQLGAGLVVLGPGTTTAAIARALGVPKTLLGVDLLEIDAAGRGHSRIPDASEADLMRATRGRSTWLVVSPTGGQGFVLGRGNQQISPAVVRAVGLERLLVIATPAKLASFGGRALLVDTGDDALDAALTNHHRILTGPGTAVLARIRAA